MIDFSPDFSSDLRELRGEQTQNTKNSEGLCGDDASAVSVRLICGECPGGGDGKGAVPNSKGNGVGYKYDGTVAHSGNETTRMKTSRTTGNG